MKLYVMRHGETAWNKLKKAQGRTDIELNETGISQALQAKKEVEKLDIDLIISSPLKRAKKTAEIISDNKIKTIFDSRLEERGFGTLEGSNTETFRWEEFYNAEKNISTDDVEPVRDLLSRINDFIIEIKEKYTDETLLLVTHGGVLRAVNACINGVPQDGILASQGYKNCEIREFNI